MRYSNLYLSSRFLFSAILLILVVMLAGCVTRHPYASLSVPPPPTLGQEGLGFGYGGSVACSFFGGNSGGGVPILEDRGLAVSQVAAICRAWNQPMIPVYRQHGLRNAMALTRSPSLPHGAIIYDPDLLNDITKRHGNAAGFGILSHEVGHVATGVRVPPHFADWSDEARADFFAGVTLARLRVSRTDTMRVFMTDFFTPSHRHPDGFTRIAVLEQGYTWGGGSPFDF
jgi:hypothetical protein